RFQPPETPSAVQRAAQAQIVNGFVKQLETADPDADVVVLGDLNDFQFSGTLAQLEDGGVLTDLITTLPPDEQYTYDFEGNSQVLDHILVSPHLEAGAPQYDAVHVNSEFSDQLSDHDPQVLRLSLIAPSPPDTSIDSGPSGTVGSSSATFTFSSNVP